MDLRSDGSWVAETCKKIAKASKDQNDLDTRLAKFTADKLLGFYTPKTKPITPLMLAEYRKSSDKEKKNFDKENPDWKEDHEIQSYLQKESEIDCENNSNVWWLNYCMDKDIGPVRKDRLQQALNKFPVDLRKHTTQRSHQDPEVEAVRQMFAGGTVKDA